MPFVSFRFNSVTFTSNWNNEEEKFLLALNEYGLFCTYSKAIDHCKEIMCLGYRQNNINAAEQRYILHNPIELC